MVTPNMSANSSGETKYANWNKGYDDLFEEITEIRALGNKVLFDFKNTNLLLNQYYAKISGLFDTHGHYVVNEDEIEIKLSKIGDVLFSEKYLDRIKSGTNSLPQQIKITRDLKKMFKEMCKSFSKNGLTMKVIITKKKASSKENLTPDEREELEALEEVGIM